ncbi:MAG: substrate-binding domain-containing protein [Pseudomonadota bacterium]
MRDRQIPYILLWSYRANSAHAIVGFDNRAAARQMADRVLAFGHRNIAMLAGVTTWNDRAVGRIEGVRDALAAVDIDLAAPYLMEAPYSVDASFEAAKTLLALTPRPTAIICGNDVQAAGALHAVRDGGLTVPDDVSVVGFDDIELARAVEPPLTTVQVPHRRMGRAAAKHLLDMINSNEPGDRMNFETSIVERRSLSSPPNRH